MNEEKKKLPNAVYGIVLVAVLAAGALIYYSMSPSPKKPEATPSATAAPTHTPFITIEEHHKKTVTTEEIKSVLAPASDLITSRYFYSNVMSFEDIKDWFGTGIDNPFTKSRGYVNYDGIVSVGIDMNDIKYEVDSSRVMIVVTLPKEKILAHEIDHSTLQSDTKESAFNNLDAEYYAKLLDGCKKETEEKVMGNSEFMKQVRENTKQVIRSFLAANELTREYGVEFKD